MLKGKAKEDFEKWLSLQDYGELFELGFEDGFFGYPFSMQHGVIVDWFRNVKIYFGNDYIYEDTNWVFDDVLDNVFNDLTQEKAIDKAVEIYNKRYESK